MNKLTAFFLAAFMLCLGIVIGFMISPVKHGVRVSVGNNNSDISVAGKLCKKSPKKSGKKENERN